MSQCLFSEIKNYHHKSSIIDTTSKIMQINPSTCLYTTCLPRFGFAEKLQLLLRYQQQMAACGFRQILA